MGSIGAPLTVLQSITANRLVRWLISAAIALLYSGPLFLGRGVPALQQDWLWPGLPAQCWNFAALGVSPWLPSGVGGPTTYPQPWLPYGVAGALCAGIGPHYSAAVFIALICFAGCLIAWHSFERISKLPLAMACATLFYWGNPVVLNELQAGHIFFLISYAILPSVWALAQSTNRRAWIALGLAIGIGAAQQQFGVFSLALAILATIRMPRRLLTVVLPAVGIAALVTAPQWILAAVYSGGHALAAIRPLPHWEDAQSAHPLDALRLLGYIGSYEASLLNPFIRSALWAVPAVAVLGLLASFKRRGAIELAVAAALSLLVIIGRYGPLRPLLDALFANVPLTWSFRELYNAAAIVAFAYAALLAYFLDDRRARFGSINVVLGLLVAAVAAAITAQSAVGIPRYDIATNSNNLPMQAPVGRFITAPAVLPVAYGTNAPSTGFTPWQIAIGHQLSGLDPRNLYPVNYASRLVAENPSRTTALSQDLRRLGISSLIPVTSLHTRIPIEPALASLLPDLPRALHFNAARTNGGSLVAVEPFSRGPGTIAARYSGARDLAIASIRKPESYEDNVTSPDPQNSWASLANWPTLEPWALAAGDGIFTLTKTRRLISPAGIIVVGTSRGVPRGSSCSSAARLDEHFIGLRCGENPIISGAPPLVVADGLWLGKLVTPRRATGHHGTSSILKYLPWLAQARVSASPGSAVVLREAFDPSWRCYGCSGAHVKVDGYANAWITRIRLDRKTVTFFYLGSAYFFGALFVSIATTIACLVLLGFQRETSSQHASAAPRDAAP